VDRLDIQGIPDSVLLSFRIQLLGRKQQPKHREDLMASGLKMMILGLTWVTLAIVLILFAIAGDIVFKLSIYAQNVGIPLTVLDYSDIQGVFPFYYALILIVEVLITYRLYEEAVSDVNSYPGL
jgi:hypothetical protein